MGDHPKYIIIEHNGLFQAIVFPAILDHFKIGQNLRVVSAGFCSLKDNSVLVWGESVTLRLKNRGNEDVKVLMKSLNFDD